MSDLGPVSAWNTASAVGPVDHAPIQFYFDFISPFGYFASLRIDELARRHGREVEWTSMLVGVSVLKVMGIPPIVDLPLKGPYVINDARRYARQHGIAFERLAPSPNSRPVEAGRAFAWAKSVDPAAAKRLAGLIFCSYFVHCLDIAQDDVLSACMREADLPWHAYEVARAQGKPASRLRRNVEESIQRGVFGSPFFIVDGEPFFGVEKLPLVEEWLATGGW
ncbi:2-hydroxychromene-2-carboxylate isomerase [Hydrogenophaga sp.]|uniref:2-hydroxychromene-2-carboxylate isomerase n=1 Tax=Hydrogenophaga sp. TaxID=1904254 RepID=UPI0025C38232|nr:2-hydroxychromene-2-carboxylate isomerase [Hydrogenophaga sp.]MBT9465629.1 2-hydroxychromene-2-carboxylate isomerase [Hydrogenophaga sp.]